jgi:hypothetical protein
LFSSLHAILEGEGNDRGSGVMATWATVDHDLWPEGGCEEKTFVATLLLLSFVNAGLTWLGFAILVKNETFWEATQHNIVLVVALSYCVPSYVVSFIGTGCYIFWMTRKLTCTWRVWFSSMAACTTTANIVVLAMVALIASWMSTSTPHHQVVSYTFQMSAVILVLWNAAIKYGLGYLSGLAERRRATGGPHDTERASHPSVPPVF